MLDTSNVVAWILENFALVMLLLALICILLHRILYSRVPEAEIVFRWVTLFPLGLTAIYAFFVHLCYPFRAAIQIGWTNSPFQYEVAMANLAIGVLGILAFRASIGFRTATVIAAMCWLWGDALIHINEILRYQNYAPGNAGSWLWMDVLIPMILLFALLRLKRIT